LRIPEPSPQKALPAAATSIDDNTSTAALTPEYQAALDILNQGRMSVDVQTIFFHIAIF
jgi:hypothetical protein